jgi:hypothetical protein
VFSERIEKGKGKGKESSTKEDEKEVDSKKSYGSDKPSREPSKAKQAPRPRGGGQTAAAHSDATACP